MRKIFLTGLFVLFSLTATVPLTTYAQSTAPKRFTLEAVLVDNGGNVLYDLQETDLRIWITDGSGETLYEETQQVMVSSGAISVMVGDGDNPDTGEATGGVPYEVMTPDGEKRLNFQIMGDSIPQEELEMGSSPYAYYAQYALDLPTDTVTTDHILNGTVTQDDLSQDLLDFIDSSITGVSEADLQAHKTEDGAHMASSISLDGGYVYISSRDLEGAIDEIDQAISTRVTDIDGVEGDVADLQGQVTQEVSDRQAGDTTLQQNINNEATTRETADNTLQQNIDDEASTRASEDAALQSNIDAEESAREAADTALDGRVDTLETAVDNLDNDLETHINTDINDAHPGEITSVTIQDGTITTTDIQNGTIATGDMASPNVSQWTNDSGYITDGNTNWDNTYGFITDGNDGWDNSYGFITDGNTNWDNSYNFITQADIDDDYVNVTGDTMTGDLTVNDLTVNDNIDVGGHVIVEESILSESTPEEGSLYKDNLIVAWARVDVGTSPPSLIGGFNIQPFTDTCSINGTICSTSCRNPDGTETDYNNSYYKLCFKTKPSSEPDGDEVTTYMVTGNVYSDGPSSTDNIVVVTKTYSDYFIIRTVNAGDIDNNVTSDDFMVMVVGWEN